MTVHNIPTNAPSEFHQNPFRKG